MAAVGSLFGGGKKATPSFQVAKAFEDENLASNQNKLAALQSQLGNKSYVNANPQAQFRGDQMRLVDALQARASGKGGPSLAEQQLQQGQEANIQAQMAQNASQRGGFNPLAQRQLANNVAMGNQAVNQQAAMLRSQEQQQAEQALSGAIQAGRQQDLGLQQLSIQEKQARDDLIKQYVAMGLSLDQAQFQALQNLAGARQGAAQQAAAASNQMGGALLGGIASVGAGFASGGK